MSRLLLDGGGAARASPGVDGIVVAAIAAGLGLDTQVVRRLLFWQWLVASGRLRGDEPVRPPAGVVWPLAEFLEVDR